MALASSETAVLTDYKSSLNDLDCNSKPMINVLTMLAEENQSFADGIVKIIKERILESIMKIKLPSLYLLDSILKNVGGDFIEIIATHMIEVFTNVFDKGDERIRMSLFKLRNTWPQYFPTAFLHQLDLTVKELDPNWPVVDIAPPSGSIHINPKFLVKKEHNSSLATAEDTSTGGPSKLKQQKEQLLAEEQRIQDQLRKLQEEKRRIIASKEEEERIAREKFLKNKQLERELMIKEQKKQIIALKQLQKEEEATFHKTVKKTDQIIEPRSLLRPKQSDPRLPKEESKRDTLDTQSREFKGENKVLAIGVNMPGKNQSQTTLKDQKCSIEDHEEEPVAKKRKSDLQEISKTEQRQSASVEAPEAFGLIEMGEKKASSMANFESLKQESAEKKRLEEIPSLVNNESHHQIKNHQIITELQKRLESREISKEAYDVLVNQITSLYNDGKSKIPCEDDDKAVDIIKSSVSLEDEKNNDSDSKSQEIHKKIQHNPIEETNDNKRLLECQAVIGSDNFVVGSVSPPFESSWDVSEKSSNTTEDNKEQGIENPKYDDNPILSDKTSESTEAKKRLIGMEVGRVSLLTDDSLKNEKRKTREINEEKVAQGFLLKSHDSTSSFDQDLEKHVSDKKGQKSKDYPGPKFGHKEMRVELSKPRNIEEKRYRSELGRNEQQISSRQRHLRGRGTLFRGRGNRKAPQLDSTQNLPHMTEKRVRRPPWRRLVEQPDMRRDFRPYLGNENDDENERVPRENKRIDFYPAGRPRFKVPIFGPRRMMGKHRFMDEKQRIRETFGAPQGSENRHDDEIMHRNQHFGEPWDFHEEENYHHRPGFYELRSNQSERKERPPFSEGSAGQFEREARTFNEDYYPMQYHNQGNIPLSEQELMRPAGVSFPPNERFLRKDEGNRPFDERSIAHDSDHFTDRFNVRNNELSLHKQSYIPHYVEDEDQFRQRYRDSSEHQFGEQLNIAEDQRTKQSSYEFDYLTGKAESFTQVRNVDKDNEASDDGIKTNSARSSKTESLIEMIRNIKQNSESVSKKEEPVTDPEPTQSQAQETPSGIKKLFEGLVSAGVLQTSLFNIESAPSPPPNIETSEDDIPNIGFVMEQLKTRHDSVINKLYSGTQCGTCGLRFTPDDKKFYRDHLDWHFRNNRIGKDGKRSTSRTWYHFKETWMDMDDVSDFEEQAKSTFFELERKLQDPATSKNNASCSVLREDEVCNICFEPFEQFWDESLEEWRYNDATRIDGMVYHINCYDDLKTGSGSDQEVSVDEISTEMTEYSPSNDLLSVSIDMNAESNHELNMNVLPTDEEKGERIKLSQTGKLLGGNDNAANESNDNSTRESPRPLKEICNAINLSDKLKDKDENEIT